MISPELEAKILRLYHAEKWRVGTIASQLDVHRDTVLRVLTQSGIARSQLGRSSKLDHLVPFLTETLKQYPTLPASRLYQMCQERGYQGSSDHFRHFVALHRPRRPAEAFARLSTLPGEQAQVDWGHFGSVSIGRAKRPLLGFVMVLSWSRRIFLRFYLGGCGANFLRGHEAAFGAFTGVPRCLLYDNLKSAVLERVADAIRFNPQLLKFAGHYRYEPRPVAVARGNEKGRVERAIGYIRRSFFLGREHRDLDDLNAQAEAWCAGVAMERRWPQDDSLTVGEAFAREKGHLLALPDNPFPIEERVEVAAGKTPYVRFDGNDYSVPHTRVRRLLVVRASLEEVRVFDGHELIASHARSFDRRAQIEDPAHVAALIEHKRQARSARAVDRLRHAVPPTEELMRRLAERGANLGSETAKLLRLLDEHGPSRLEAAVAEALSKDVLHHHAIRHILERERAQSGELPPIPVVLPDDPRLRDLSVRPPDLGSYDALGRAPEAADGEEVDA